MKYAEEEAKIESILNVNHDCDIAKKFGVDHYDAMHERVTNCPDQNLAAVWKQYEADISVGDAKYRGHEHCMGSKIYVNGANDAKGNSFQTPYQVTFHESGHAIDYLARNKVENPTVFSSHYSSLYKNGLFPNTIKEEVSDLVSAKDKELKALFKEHKTDFDWLHDNGFISDWSFDFYKKHGRWPASAPKYSKSYAYAAIEKEVKGSGSKVAYGDLSDILEGATGAKIQCGIGHGASYWKQRTFGGVSDGLATEAFAEMIDSSFANAESLETIKKYLPKSYAVFQEMIEDLLK